MMKMLQNEDYFEFIERVKVISESLRKSGERSKQSNKQFELMPGRSIDPLETMYYMQLKQAVRQEKTLVGSEASE